MGGIQYISIIVGLGWGTKLKNLRKILMGQLNSLELQDLSTCLARNRPNLGTNLEKPNYELRFIYQKRTTNPPDLGKLLKFRYFEFGFLSKRIKGQGRTHYYIYHGKLKMYTYLPT